jgi:hypothetical protein
VGLSITAAIGLVAKVLLTRSGLGSFA